MSIHIHTHTQKGNAVLPFPYLSLGTFPCYPKLIRLLWDQVLLGLNKGSLQSKMLAWKKKTNQKKNDGSNFIRCACIWFVKPREMLIEAVVERWATQPGLITSKWYLERCSLHIAVGKKIKKAEWIRLSPRIGGLVAVNINFCSGAHWGDRSVGENCDWCLIRASQIPAESFHTRKICSKLIYWQNENQRRVWSVPPVTVIFLILRFLYGWSPSHPYTHAPPHFPLPPTSTHCLIK